MPSAEIRYQFHPVGQGLFCSGKIKPITTNFESFCWVYDCGTLEDKKFPALFSEIQSLSLIGIAHGNGDRPSIDLLVISHFDKDHISGVANLLSTYSVDTILIPYVVPWNACC